MPAPYSSDFRLKVVNSYLKRGSLRKTAERFDVSYKFVQTLVRRYKMKNTVEPEPHKSGNPPKVRPVHAGFLEKLIEKENDLSLEELCVRFKGEFSISVSVTGMHESLKRLDITKKKTFHDPKKGTDITKWIGYFIELMSCNRNDCIFIDETGCCLNMAPLYGRSLRGERVYAERPTAKGERISMIGALSFRGMLDCMSFTGTLNGSVFSYYIEHFIVKYLRPGKVVILDNASPHKNEEALNLIEDTGAKVLFLPTYSPELNPVEFCWSKIKNFLKKLKARTREELYEGYSSSLRLINLQMAKSCFRHCGL